MTLDLARISSKGIISGSSFIVAPLSDMPMHFAFSPPGSGADSASGREQQLGTLERLIEGLQKRDEAAASFSAAEAVRLVLA